MKFFHLIFLCLLGLCSINVLANITCKDKPTKFIIRNTLPEGIIFTNSIPKLKEGYSVKRLKNHSLKIISILNDKATGYFDCYCPRGFGCEPDVDGGTFKCISVTCTAMCIGDIYSS